MLVPAENTSGTVVLLNEAALELPLDILWDKPPGRVIVAGKSLVRMTLAELSFPGAQIIWTDFEQSASLRSLHSSIQEIGGLDRLVLAGDGSDGESMFSLMCAILTFLPALRRKRNAQIVLSMQDGPSIASLRQFLRGLSLRLERDGIGVLLQIERTCIRSVAA